MCVWGLVVERIISSIAKLFLIEANFMLKLG